MKTLIKRYWHWGVVTLLFLWLVLIRADVPIWSLVSKRVTVERLENEIAEYQEQITSDSLFLESLKDDAELEKYAREKFYMHAEGEEVYLFEE